MIKREIKNQGAIALIMVIMITALTLLAAVSISLINISDSQADYQASERAVVEAKLTACLDEALLRLSSDYTEAGYFSLVGAGISCDYEISAEIASGLKEVSLSASSTSSLGFWQSSVAALVNVSSTPISVYSYKNDPLAYASYSSGYCGDAVCNGYENCQTCPNDCGACLYHIVQGSDDWYIHSVSGTINNATNLLATYISEIDPAVTSLAYGDISTGGLADDADISAATLYLYFDSYNTSAPPKTAQPAKTFYVKVFFGGEWQTIHSGTFLTAGWYYYELTLEQLAYINKTGNTRFLIGVEDPGAGYGREMSIRSYEYTGDYSMYLDISVVE